MGMSIDLAIKVLKRMIRKGIAYDDGYAFEPLAQDEEKACSIAIDTMNSYQMMRADYENRLKADMVAMLTEIQLEIEELDSRAGYSGDGMPTFSTDYIRKKKVYELVQQKINALKEKIT